MIELQVKDAPWLDGLHRIAAGYRSPRPLMRAIAGLFEAETDANFDAQGRPKWLGLKPATLRRRGAGAKILQDTGRLAASVATDYGRDYARVGSNAVYAAIHQFGGTIDRAAFSSWGALRTDRHGNLLRQGSEGRAKNLAVFAKGSHKRTRAIRYTVAAHQIRIPARPYMPFDASGTLQPTTQAGVIRLGNDYLASLIGPGFGK